jgi:hypothetical protein
MTTRWHELRKAVRKSVLRPSDRQVYVEILSCSSYVTGDLEPRFTPTLEEVARGTGLGSRTVSYALRHLEQHGWIKVSWPQGPGRGHKLDLTLMTGEPCDPRTCPARRRATVKGADEDPVKGADEGPEKAQTVTLKGANEDRVSAAQTPDPTIRAPTEGGRVEEAENPRSYIGKCACQPQTPDCYPQCMADGCGSLARHKCRTCWDHAYLEAGEWSAGGE